MLSEVIVDNKQLLLEKILPLPARLYEPLLGAAVGEDHQHVWQQSSAEILARLEKFLVRKKTACQLAYEDKFCSQVNDYQSYISDKSDSDNEI